MRRRSGQSGQIVRKGNKWYVRFYVDVPGEEKRVRTALPVGPATGKERLTKPEAERKGAEIVAAHGVNKPEHLQRAIDPRSIQTFAHRTDWCRKHHRAWTDGKPGPIRTLEGHLAKHILPRFGSQALTDITETDVQEFISELKGKTFERRRKNGELIKTYRLSRKSVLNIVGVVKLILGRKAWLSWDLDVGRQVKTKQRYFTEPQLRQIVEAAQGQYKVLFALLAETGLRFGEAAGLHVDDLDFDHGVISVRRSVWNGQELTPKTECGTREIDIDLNFAAALRQFVGERTSGRLFRSRSGSPLSAGNIRKRILHPLLEQLGIASAGLHAFRHSRVTVLRKRGTPGDLQRKWVGHSSLTTTDRYSHTDEELEYRREAAEKAGIGLLDPTRVVGPNEAGKENTR